MSDRPPPTVSGAVFLSYAREDTGAARRIADALRAFGVEVWFDQSELRGGDTWDSKIKKQIRECALFVPLVSAQTQSRTEGYFRREWLLAVERTRDMAHGVAFVVPVVIDDTTEADAAVPEEFMRYQWTRLAHGVPSPQFVEQIKRLLEAPRKAAPATRVAPVAPAAVARSAPAFPKLVIAALAAVILGLVAYVVLRPTAREVAPAARSVAETKIISAPPASNLPSPASLVPLAPDKSIAVLPFANMSPDKDNEFFADGVQDDVITNLAKIRDLTVISRTSTLAYRDAASRNLKKIAGELGVATVLEGSVRRVGSKVHVNAQLIDARTDAHLWADTFDGDTGDIFALQASLAQKIATALKATLTPGERTLIERRPTQNQEAYDFYSRARLLHPTLIGSSRAAYEAVVALYEQALAKDPAFALAYAQLSILHSQMYWYGTIDPSIERRGRAEKALAMAEKLVPMAAETHLAKGAFAYNCDNDWRGSLAELALAERDMPNDAQLQSRIGAAHRRLGNWTEAVERFERAATLDPHNLDASSSLVGTNSQMRRFERTRAQARHYLNIFPGERGFRSELANSQYALDGDRAAYMRARIELGADSNDSSGLRNAYDIAIFSGDLAGAQRVLADPRLPEFWTSGSSVILEPSALRRTMVAFLLGQRDAAARNSDDVIAFYRTRTWTPRQRPYAQLGVAEAEAYAGRAEAAIRDGVAAAVEAIGRDPSAAGSIKVGLCRIYVALDRREEALASLREAISVPGIFPLGIYDDPVLSRLKDDPRFEEILKSAKVF